jgi:hypothetical protein
MGMFILFIVSCLDPQLDLYNMYLPTSLYYLQDKKDTVEILFT